MGGLRKIFDTLLAVRPDVKIVFSSYDYIGGNDSRAPDMATVQAYNEANETYSQVVIDFIDDNYKSPPRAFFVNNLGLMQYTFGYPGPDPGTIPAYFWPDGPPATPHGFRFGPGPPSPGQPPLYPGGESTSYVPLPGGDPTFRISPYCAQMDPPADGWIHLNATGYTVLLEHVIDEHVVDWLEKPKVYSVTRTTINPVTSGIVGDEAIGFAEVSFEVRFSEQVDGVDETDFVPLMAEGVGAATVASVAMAKDGLVYTVIVDTGEGNGTLSLAVLDDNSIVDGDDNSLGGPELNDGYFGSGETYTMDRNASMPVCAWPAALVLLGLGTIVSRRRR